MVAAKNSKLLLWLRILQERKKREKMNTLITYITLRRRRLRNLLFLLLQNEALSQSNYSNERFKTIFRVSRETFTNILGFICDDLQREYLCETPISPEERLGICLYRLGREDYYQTISELTRRQ